MQTEPAREGSALEARITRRIEWSDTDASGHHHNSVIWRLVEACEAELFGKLGWRDEYFGSAPRVRHEVDYEDRLYFGQEVTAILTLEHLGTASMSFTFEVWGGPREGMPASRAASGRLVTVHVSHAAAKSSPWPPQLRRAIEAARG